MNNIILSGVLSFLTTFAASPTATDSSDRSGTHRGKGDRMCQALQCSDEQRVQLEAIRAEHREQMADERARAKEIRAALQAERGSPNPDKEAIERLVAERRALAATMKEARHDKRAQMGTVLTPEQREQWDAMRAERQAAKQANKRANKKERKAAKRKRKHDDRTSQATRWSGQGDGTKARARVGRRGSDNWAKAEHNRERRGKARARGKGKGKGKGKAFARRGRTGAKDFQAG
ncbi:MAG: Spy/CpxP family protein refolding chaperone [Myxococcota bacterium]